MCVPGNVKEACDFRPVFTVPPDVADHSLTGRMVSWVESHFESCLEAGQMPKSPPK